MTSIRKPITKKQFQKRLVQWRINGIAQISIYTVDSYAMLYDFIAEALKYPSIQRCEIFFDNSGQFSFGVDKAVEFIKKLSNLLRTNKTLTALEMRNFYFSNFPQGKAEECQTEFLKALSESNITELNIPELLPNLWFRWLHASNFFNKLTALVLGDTITSKLGIFNSVSEDDANILLQGTQYKTLCLNNHRFESKSLDNIISVLGRNTQLESLSLANTGMEDEHLSALCKILADSKTIKSLDLSQNDFSENALQLLEPVLKQRKLRKFYFRGNKLTQEHFDLLKPYMQGENLITHWDLRGNKFKLSEVSVDFLKTVWGENSQIVEFNVFEKEDLPSKAQVDALVPEISSNFNLCQLSNEFEGSIEEPKRLGSGKTKDEQEEIKVSIEVNSEKNRTLEKHFSLDDLRLAINICLPRNRRLHFSFFTTAAVELRTHLPTKGVGGVVLDYLAKENENAHCVLAFLNFAYEYSNERDSLSKLKQKLKDLDAGFIPEHLGRTIEGDEPYEVSRETTLLFNANAKATYGIIDDIALIDIGNAQVADMNPMQLVSEAKRLLSLY